MKRMLTLSSQLRRHAGRTAPIVLFSLLVTLTPAIAFAHAVVYPKKSTAGAYERYVLRVPNEKTAATTRIEIRFPEGLRITDFQEVPGWSLQVLTDSAQRIVGAVWTGNLPPQRFAEFAFMAANPKTTSSLVWSIYQTYEGMPRVDWTGPKGSKTPASVTEIVPADSSTAIAAPGESTAATVNTASTGSTAAPSFQWVQWLALVIAVVALGIAIRPRDRGV